MDNESKLFVGPIHSEVAGRTDHLPVNVPSGAYVIPADIVSGLGESNTMAGFRDLNDMFGIQKINGDEEPVEVIVAGGEYILSPSTVIMIGGGDIDRGHTELDKFVKLKRSETIKTLKNLPGPRRD